MPLLLAGVVFRLKGKGADKLKLPEKDYLTFGELAKKWDCKEVDLFHYVATRKITPSYFVSGNYELFMIDPIESDENGICSNFKYEYQRGIFFLNLMEHTERRECSFRYFSNKRELSEFDFFYSLNNPVTINLVGTELIHVDDNLVFVKEEINRFELENFPNGTAKSEKQTIEKELNGKARNSALLIIGGLVMSTYKMDIHAKKLNGLSEIVDDLNRVGISITSETVSEWIKESAEIIEKKKI